MGLERKAEHCGGFLRRGRGNLMFIEPSLSTRHSLYEEYIIMSILWMRKLKLRGIQ